MLCTQLYNIAVMFLLTFSSPDYYSSLFPSIEIVDGPQNCNEFGISKQNVKCKFFLFDPMWQKLAAAEFTEIHCHFITIND